MAVRDHPDHEQRLLGICRRIVAGECPAAPRKKSLPVWAGMPQEDRVRVLAEILDSWCERDWWSATEAQIRGYFSSSRRLYDRWRLVRAIVQAAPWLSPVLGSSDPLCLIRSIADEFVFGLGNERLCDLVKDSVLADRVGTFVARRDWTNEQFVDLLDSPEFPSASPQEGDPS